jgi:hypothetical protein
MKKFLLGLAILPFVAGVALAAQPLSDKQMDKVVAGHDLSLVETTDVSIIGIRVNEPVVVFPPTGPQPYLNVILPLTTIQVYSFVVP